MTSNTDPGLLERLVKAQEIQADVLGKILEVLTNFKAEQVGSIAVMASVSIPEEDDATEETKAQEDAAGEPGEPGLKDAGDAEEPAENEASSEDGDEGDPLGDGNASEHYVLPEKLTNDTLRGFARNLMEKEGKAAVFEVLADVGTGYKAVGEVSKDDLKEAHEKMAERLKG